MKKILITTLLFAVAGSAFADQINDCESSFYSWAYMQSADATCHFNQDTKKSIQDLAETTKAQCSSYLTDDKIKNLSSQALKIVRRDYDGGKHPDFCQKVEENFQ